MSLTDIPNFDKLSDVERLALAEEVYASIRNPESLPVPLCHQQELERRWAEYEQNPAIALSSEEFWDKVNASKKNNATR